MMMNLKNIPVLVTGASGFIGSHLTKRLIEIGAKVNVFVCENSSLWRLEGMNIKEKVELFHVDVTDYSLVRRSIRKIKPSKVYHLAAFVDVSRSLHLLDNMVDVNVKGTLNLVRALEDIDFDCFINTGTCEEYGNNEVPFTEIQRENPVSPYSASKVATTYFCQMLHKTQVFPVVTLRPFLTYGPYQTNDMLIPSLIRKCLNRQEFEMTKGEQTREFNYVTDVVEGYIKASITKSALGEIINLGNGIEYKVIDVVKMIVNLLNNPITPQVGALPYRPGETMHFYCNNEKATRILNWEPKVPLEEGLKKTIHWYKGYLRRH